MPVSFLNEAERIRFNSFPPDLSNEDLIAHFTLGENDLRQIPATTSAANRLGFALHFLVLRFLGFYLPDLTTIPGAVIDFVASQIRAQPEDVRNYGEREATRTAHKQAIESYLGFRHPTENDLNRIGEWLLERALEHDRPTLLFQLLCERLSTEKLVRPGLSVVERMVSTVRNSAEEEIYKRIEFWWMNHSPKDWTNFCKRRSRTARRRSPGSDKAPLPIRRKPSWRDSVN